MHPTLLPHLHKLDPGLQILRHFRGSPPALSPLPVGSRAARNLAASTAIGDAGAGRARRARIAVSELAVAGAVPVVSMMIAVGLGL